MPRIVKLVCKKCGAEYNISKWAVGKDNGLCCNCANEEIGLSPAKKSKVQNAMREKTKIEIVVDPFLSLETYIPDVESTSVQFNPFPL